MDRLDALRAELERARRLAAQSHDPKVVALLSDYAGELECKLRGQLPYCRPSMPPA